MRSCRRGSQKNATTKIFDFGQLAVWWLCWKKKYIVLEKLDSQKCWQ